MTWDQGTGEVLVISIHALREEGDLSGFDAVEIEVLFLSTPSARRATFRQQNVPQNR